MRLNIQLVGAEFKANNQVFSARSKQNKLGQYSAVSIAFKTSAEGDTQAQPPLQISVGYYWKCSLCPYLLPRPLLEQRKRKERRRQVGPSCALFLFLLLLP